MQKGQNIRASESRVCLIVTMIFQSRKVQNGCGMQVTKSRSREFFACWSLGGIVGSVARRNSWRADERTEVQFAPLLQQEKMARFLALFLTAVYKQLYRDMGADMRSADTRVHALSAVCRHPTIYEFSRREKPLKDYRPLKRREINDVDR